MTAALTLEQLEQLPAYVPVCGDVRNGTQIVAQKSPNGFWWSTWKNPVELAELWNMVTLNGGKFVALPIPEIVSTTERLAALPLGTIVINRHGDVGVVAPSEGPSLGGVKRIAYVANVDSPLREMHDLVTALDGPWTALPLPPTPNTP